MILVRGAAAGLLLALLMAAGCGDEEAPAGKPARPYALGLYAGELSPMPTVTAALPRMAASGFSVMVAVPSATFPQAELATLLRQAHAQQVDVRLWPLLTKAQGYWPNEANVPAFAAQVRKILAWLKAQGLRTSTIIYDMEPAIAYSKAIEEGFSKGLGASIELMKKHLDKKAHAAAKEKLRLSIKEVQAAGLRAQCVTFPQVLDDLADGDSDLQDALDIPVDGLPWDELSFMVYQSTYARTVGAWIGPDLVRLYSELAHKRYGLKATIALGVVGKEGVMSSGANLYPDAATLAKDIAAARSQGIGRLEIFSLDGVLAEKNPEAWLSAMDKVQPKAPTPSSQADLIHTTMKGMDALLD